MKKSISAVCIILLLISMISIPAYAAKKDTKAPVITKTDPTDYDSEVMIESTIIIRFSEAVLKGKAISKISFKEFNLKAAAFSYEIKDNFLIIKPKQAMKYNTIYTVCIPSAAVKDETGNYLAQSGNFNFITEEDPVKLSQEEQTAQSNKYIIKLEATMDEELTDVKIAYFDQILKNFGIDASIVDITEADRP